jgi:hypothetical protein
LFDDVGSKFLKNYPKFDEIGKLESNWENVRVFLEFILSEWM